MRAMRQIFTRRAPLLKKRPTRMVILLDRAGSAPSASSELRVPCPSLPSLDSLLAAFSNPPCRRQYTRVVLRPSGLLSLREVIRLSRGPGPAA